MEKNLTKRIVIGLTDDDQCGINVSPDMDCATAFQLVGTLALHLMNAFYQVAVDIETNNANDEVKPSEKEIEAAKQGLKESMYDAMDSVFSSVLTQFYPDAPKNQLEEEAILELVNKKIEDRYNAMSKEERARHAQAYNKMKLQMEYRIRTTKKEDSNGTDVSEGNARTETTES